MPLYFGEATGPRVFQYGVGLSQLDDNYQPSFETWDMTPAEEVGDVVYRSLSLSFSYTNGYSLGVTPVIDGTLLSESQFNGVGSAMNGMAQIFLGVRGTRISANVRVISQQGQYSFFNLQATFTPIRVWP